MGRGRHQSTVTVTGSEDVKRYKETDEAENRLFSVSAQHGSQQVCQILAGSPAVGVSPQPRNIPNVEFFQRRPLLAVFFLLERGLGLTLQREEDHPIQLWDHPIQLWALETSQ